MQVQSITLSKSIEGNSLGAVATFPVGLAASMSDPYILRAISGLDAEEITPQLYGQGGSGATSYFNMKLQPRDVVMRITLNPNYSAGQTPSSLRDALYKAIAAYRTAKVDLSFSDGTSEVGVLGGFITRFESALTTPTPEVQITIRCPYPYFRSRSRIPQNMTGVSKSAPVITDNLSTAPHGFRAQLTMTASFLGFTWRRSDNDWFFFVNFSFNTGDILEFCTEEDNRYLFVRRSGSVFNIANQIQPGSQWPNIFPGTNGFTSSVSTYDFTLIEFYTTSWGV